MSDYDDAVIIRDRLPGYMDAWGRLSEPLMAKVMQCFRRSFSAENAEDLCQQRMLEWTQDIVEGHFLLAWDPKRGPPVTFLASKYIVREAWPALKKMRGKEALSGEVEDLIQNAAVGRSPPTFTQANDEAEDPVLYGDGPWTLRPLGPKGINRYVQMAGVQLWGTLDWDAAPADKVMDTLPGFLEATDQPWDDTLEHTWTKARNRLAADLQACDAEIQFRAATITPRQRRILERRHTRTRANYRFRPIDAEGVMKLTGMKRNNADQLLKRYREQLPNMVNEISTGLFSSGEETGP